MTRATVIREAEEIFRRAGLLASVIVRDLESGEEIGIDPDRELALASLVKVPLAMATLGRIESGQLRGGTQLEVQPGLVSGPGPTGISRFRHPVRVAIDDLLYLSTSVSDGAAADALFELTPPAAVTAALREWGLTGLTVRTMVRELTETPAEKLDHGDTHLAHVLAIAGMTIGRGNAVQQLDVSRSSSGTARGFADILAEIWVPKTISSEVSQRMRDLLGANVFRQRLSPEVSSDSSKWSSKTGTLLNLRHEGGVLENIDGTMYAIVMMTESTVAASIQPEIDVAMGRVARMLRDYLRDGQ